MTAANKPATANAALPTDPTPHNVQSGEHPEDNKEEYIEDDDEDITVDRAKWETEGIVLSHLVGYVVGLLNVWRLPYLFMKHGGILFLIPYFLFLLLVAFPFVYLELLVGQFAQAGSIAAFKLVPLFKGVGMCMTFLAYIYCFNMQAALAWCLYYLFQSLFHRPLPWVSCDNGFARNPNGTADHNRMKWITKESPETEEMLNWHTDKCWDFYADAEYNEELEDNMRLPGTEYFLGRVQRMWKSHYSDHNYTHTNGNEQDIMGIDNKTGSFQGILMEYNSDTMVALITTFLVIQAFIQRGTKINAKCIGLLVIIPYIIIALLLFRFSGLNGASEGLSFFFKPDSTKLSDGETWWRAAEQVFRSTGAGLGVHLTFGSHNYCRNVLFDASVSVTINTITSILSACVICMLIGHGMTLLKSVTDYVYSGPELVFQLMADLLGLLAKSNFYACCFYAMLFLMGLTTVTATLLCAKTSLLEVLPPSFKNRPKTKFIIITTLSLLSLIISSLSLTRGGLHVYLYLEAFIGSYLLIMSSIFFLIAIAWFWGLEEILLSSQLMGLREPGIYFQLCWKYISILLLSIVLIGLLSSPTSHIVEFAGKEMHLSSFLLLFGYCISGIPLLFILYGAFSAVSRIPGKNLNQRLLASISPKMEHEYILETGDADRARLSHYFYLYASNPQSRWNFCCSKTIRGNQVAPENPELDDDTNDPTFMLTVTVPSGPPPIQIEKLEEEPERPSRKSATSRKRSPSTDSTMKEGACAIA